MLLVACGSSGQRSNSLIRFVEEPPGAHCANGGTQVKSGLDTSGNESLEDGEVTSTAYVCNGSSGGETSRALVRMDAEPVGTNCAQGGTRVSSGLDGNGNGTLEAGEVTSTSFVCNGAPGNSSDTKALVRTTSEPVGSNCAQGGTAVQSGLDSNQNGQLDPGEVSSTAYICNGASGSPGVQALVRLEAEPAGANCAQGGTVVFSGLDSDRNGTLDASEVNQTRYVCSAQSAFATGWAASAPTDPSGEVPAGFWFNSGRKVSIFKTSASSRLKITISDTLAAGMGVNGGSAYYRLRMNSGYVSPDCFQRQYVWNSSGWTNTYSFPFATVCLTEALPAGLYEFDTWAFSSGGIVAVGVNAFRNLVLVEELLPTAKYGFSTEGGITTVSGTTFRKAPGRTVTFTKQASSSLLKVTLADTFRISSNMSAGTVLIKMDGFETSCSTGQYDGQGTNGDFHHPIVMTCVFPSVSAGAHTFDVWIRSSSTSAEAYLGWERSYPLLLVEEIENQKLAYTNGSSPSGELSGNWAGVGSRQVQYTVSAAQKTVRVTYSDTFRGTVGCNGSWGFYQLYVDGQPTGCITGQSSYNSGSSAQEHHHPINQTCLVRDLAPGPHTFAIWSTTVNPSNGTACGSNYFGWNRGQNLLLVEEMP
ncbi:DUF7151 family protein [Hyalangium versicolor]|uniref:DUF7151 family protein n=1 Tax=Hyalangium versicolor TaxID=2861190 RepID=UPI001CCFF4C9|nr:hypothetical protein [Hyalangium versicolor]